MNKVTSISDFIYVIDNALDEKYCSNLIDKFESDLEHQHVGLIGSGVDKSVKDTTDLKISNFPHWKDEDVIVSKCVKETLCKYINYIDNLIGQDEKFSALDYRDSGYQIQRYDPGGGYAWHHDFMSNPDFGSRFFTFIFYLNDVEVDGYTEFLDGTRVRPKAGRAVYFPSTWNYFHRGYRPKNSVKYILTGWIYTKFEEPVFNFMPQ